ncbi:MAG: tRNA (adenosine(37)-N6)-threonylcarbamoyltransferase complex transferase subunit TsaD [Xanthomarina sp.]|uniref:tRNA N6-adenosine threonylcarbamoyltransferase n=1 Tax=Xanthomarina gelatinilytica TaxID=1137281 RepID=A0A3D6BVF0_9FLAO|nr:tRNA (adenosine(37)-N6)-threonylcarbamoyltransferase complex transferase subunit TsaD [Xanthomarina sp.]MAL23334.1 tRNA (adenosine(37)-N6)-threonylcarbamoyltransferase complex transferase subunit TsaD [Xanthomarina sp.]MBF60734.1 tRNA (adenosine(37)-N6)-threonylcarbamoyltransferase complex transferase subunit TsaD [Xanthomarina sp.]HAI17068.1 tRNA (adenosine(37)-N6)-threonylcarbamoyltransferase complex transferase subunit TsaD [Xanthomarina gelatinilytica]HCY82998.1 tRNA (adenosine(37)-N6)-t|tara:strand:+ start:1558 stop:2580 length:1023 start_codon:yes stop_codon:yes gene_type:complete
MTSENIYILGIESSCDDTAAAVIHNGKILSNVIANQKIHEAYGGVVPELASRAHQQNIVPVVDQALKKANIAKEQLQAIAFTRGPGLMGSLLVGTSFAKSLAMGLNIPLIDVNHMQAHILAHFIDEDGFNKPPFPFLAMTISGGHTQIVKVSNYFDMEVIGETIDDAVGEAYDKSGKILGLGYPAGPQIDKRAQLGNPKAFKFTKPKVAGLNFSFSGLKTAILYFIQKETANNPNFVEENINDICASIQYTIIGILIDKLKLASKQTGIKHIAIGGGVSANSGIRQALKTGESKFGWTTYVPKFEFTTDNAAMIAIVGYLKYLENDFTEQDVTASARLKI